MYENYFSLGLNLIHIGVIMKMYRLIEKLQELKALLENNIVSKEWYYRELDELIRYAKNKDEIKMINTYKDLDI